jgi:plastocyanin
MEITEKHMRKTAITALFLLLASCGTPGEDGGFAHISMMDNFFSPPLSRIHRGGQIEFFNKGLNPHNAIAVDRSWSTEATYGDLSMLGGAKTRVTYPVEGVFPYYCSFHATPDGKLGMVGTVVVGNVEFKADATGKARSAPEKWSGRTRKVPQEHPTIQNAVDAASPGDLILIDKGVYREEVVVTTPGLILRGVSRNETIIDGEFVRGNGILVVGADGVAIENMTARNATLNGFFWTGVTGFRGSYLTAYNNGDYGLYAFDSTDGIFEYSYASGSPDSSFYIGQCYPCRAILYNNIGENNAMGYSGTNSGGDLYLINNIFRNNMVGAGPNTLDSELLPPERETTLIGNIMISNNNRNAPAKTLTYPSYGNGILIAGGIRNRIEKNLILGHSNNGILIIPNLQENFWLSYDNAVKDNIILDSGRADLAVAGPVSTGNCFEGNRFHTEIPFGLSAMSACNSPVRFISGGDLSMMMGALAMMIEAKLGLATMQDYKTQPVPPAQPEMPDEVRARIQPAVNVFEQNRSIINHADYHSLTEQYVREYGPSRLATAGSIQPVLPYGVPGMLYHVFAFLLPITVYAAWTSLAFFDMHQRNSLHHRPFWTALLMLLPFLGAFLYHLRSGSTIPAHIRVSMLATGAGVFLVFVFAAVLVVL